MPFQSDAHQQRIEPGITPQWIQPRLDLEVTHRPRSISNGLILTVDVRAHLWRLKLTSTVCWAKEFARG